MRSAVPRFVVLDSMIEHYLPLEILCNVIFYEEIYKLHMNVYTTFNQKKKKKENLGKSQSFGWECLMIVVFIHPVKKSPY